MDFGRPRTGLAIRGGRVLDDSMKPIETSLDRALLHANKQAWRRWSFFVIPSMGLGLSGCHGFEDAVLGRSGRGPPSWRQGSGG